MAKELVISCNRHETKVAVLEDEQLVEIHFQRANEYSLAGSIHKGRVTRVLPGMQSAFVDIGLERDAFLYVSDFVEETEEYDRIPVNLQERAAERTAAELSQDSGGRRDRALRRSRRRRLRGHGLAEPKHAQQAAERAEKTETESEFAILPGESLAKYKGLLGEQAPEAAEPPEQQSDEEASGGLLEAAEASAASAEELEPASGDEVEEAAQGFEAPAGLAAAPAENAPELPESLGEAEASAGPQPATQEPGQPESWGEQARAEQEPEGSSQAEEEAAEAGGEEGEPSEVPAETLASEQSTEAPETSPSQAAEEIEPARKPVSLTATLREQGLRYLHRPPRRLRRKMRGGRTQGERAETERGTRKAEAGAEDRPSQPSITDLLREGQEVLVQIAKEPLGQKGARITSHITLPGRYVVYMPTVEHLGVSRKIASDEERARLKRILYRNRGDIPGGFIVRTAGEGRSEEHIAADMRFLYNLWLEIKRKAENSSAPALIHHDLDLVSRTLRDELTDDFKTIWTDNEEVYERVVRFVEKFQPSLVGRVKLYTRPTPIFDAFNISQELEKALRPKVWLKSGGYIVINQTEALVAIDVNTGKFVGKSNRLEDTIFRTNTEAVKEIVRQIRLRDLGGIIVIDFIDMEDRKNRQRLMQTLEEAMRVDRAPYKILQFNDFGLVAITRKRVKQSLERALCSPCPYCDGAGYVKSVQTVIGEILQEAHRIRGAIEGGEVLLRVNPEVAKELKAKGNDYLEELEEILGRPVLVTSDPTLQQEKFSLV